MFERIETQKAYCELIGVSNKLVFVRSDDISSSHLSHISHRARDFQKLYETFELV